jgi:hypothetical protein
MAPSKAPATKGPARALPPAAKPKRLKKPPLTPREIHDIALKVLSLAAVADGPTVVSGSRLEASLHEGLRMIRDLVALTEASAPLAEVVTRDGSAATGFLVSHFDQTWLYREVVEICKRHKKHIGDPRFKVAALAEDLFVVFARGRNPIDRAAAASMAEIASKKGRHLSPGRMAGSVLSYAGLPSTRQMQNLLSVRSAARQSRAHLGERGYASDLAVVEEFLTCLRIPRREVQPRAQELLLVRRKPFRGRGDYALRDASPARLHDPSREVILTPKEAKQAARQSRRSSHLLDEDPEEVERPDDDPDWG